MKIFFTPKSDILRFLVKFQKVGGTLHNVYIGQYLFLATEQGEINTTHPNYDIIQHILIPACSVARKTPFMQFFNIFPSFTL